MAPYRCGLIWLMAGLLAACGVRATANPTLDAGILNATRYPAVAVNKATVAVMRQTQEAQRAELANQPTFTPSPLDMVADDPASFHLASGEIQFIEFFRYG
jgi:hypothetical protein